MPSSAAGQCFVETYGMSGDYSLQGEGHGCFSPSPGAREYLAVASLCAGTTTEGLWAPPGDVLCE